MALYELIKLKPFSVKVIDSELIIKFAYSGLSMQGILSDVLYTFIPKESKEIRIDLETRTITNAHEVFVFHAGFNIKKLPIIALYLSCLDFREEILEIVENYKNTEETNNIIAELEQQNIQREIDRHLEMKDYETCRKLVSSCDNSTSMASH